MPSRVIRTLLIAATLAVVSLPTVSADASAGPGSFTRITTPGGPSTTYHFDVAGPNNLTVSGVTSADVTTVDIDCLYRTQGDVGVQTFAASVPVTGSSFNVNASIGSFPNNCRLRAIPAGVDPTSDYLGSYAGPILYANAVGVATDGGQPVGYTAIAEQGSGQAAANDAAECGENLSTIQTPAMDLLGPGHPFCAFALLPGNLTTAASTASAIVVDGHNAYLPGAVSTYLNGTLSLALTQTKLTVAFVVRSSGDITVTESAPLVRCSVADTYPPTSGSCPALVNTGVSFARTVDLFRGSHQIRFRDSFRSTDSTAHTVGAQYRASLTPPPAGQLGYRFPSHAGTFTTVAPNQVITGFGGKAGTLLARSDIDSTEGDPQADTMAFSWSRPPSQVKFGPTGADRFAMPYSLTVPAAGRAYVGFAVSQANTTTGAANLAAIATHEVVVAPTISSPKPGAVIHGHTTTVKGAVSLGANGLPKSVTVNGHAATLTKVSAIKETYAVTFGESFAKHTLTVVAKDVVGNTASRSVRVTNKA